LSVGVQAHRGYALLFLLQLGHFVLLHLEHLLSSQQLVRVNSASICDTIGIAQVDEFLIWS